MQLNQLNHPPLNIDVHRSVLISLFSITPDDLVVFGIEPLFKENKSYNKGNCYGRNDHKQDCQLMLLASFT